MNILVLGAGAIGSLYGAKLSKLNEVTLIGRKEHVDAINKSGLKITGIENSTFKVKAALKINEIRKNTLVLLATKVTNSEEAAKSIKNIVKKDTIILCLQNGLYSENVAKKILKNKCLVLRAVTNFGASFLNPGIVKYNSYSYTAIEKSDKSVEIAENFRRCGLNGYVSKDIKDDMWKKLALNCVLNPITSILKIKNNEISDERLNSLKKLVIDECANVAKKDGIRLDLDVEQLNNAFKNSLNISSMQQDLIKGKRTEIDYLNGGVAELGKKYGIKCPVNEALAEIIKGMEKSS
jgi:2-dehydropantoate 2-reductase